MTLLSNRSVANRTDQYLLRGFFVLLMASTGIAKLLDMQGFYAIVTSYQTLPVALVPFCAWVLALTETGLALWLLSGRAMRRAAVTIILLHLMYLAWQLFALYRGLSLDNCGCFGVYWARPLTWFSPLEDCVLLLFAVLFWRRTANA